MTCKLYGHLWRRALPYSAPLYCLLMLYMTVHVICARLPSPPCTCLPSHACTCLLSHHGTGNKLLTKLGMPLSSRSAQIFTTSVLDDITPGDIKVRV